MPSELYRIRHRIFGPSVGKTLKKTECAICTEAFCNGDELSALPCAHFFHKKVAVAGNGSHLTNACVQCLDPWLDRANTCPFCRRVVQAPKPAPSPRAQPSYNSSAASAWTPPAGMLILRNFTYDHCPHCWCYRRWCQYGCPGARGPQQGEHYTINTKRNQPDSRCM